MSNEQALAQMQAAWATRRRALDAEGAEQSALLGEAQQLLSATAELCRNAGSSAELAQALHLRANVEVDLGNDDAAQTLWEEAVALLREADEPLELAHKVRHLGDLQRHGGRLDEADACYSEALELHRQHDADHGLDFANLLRRVALLREAQADPELAVTVWQQARDAYAALDIEAGVEEAEQSIVRLRTH